MTKYFSKVSGVRPMTIFAGGGRLLAAIGFGTCCLLLAGAEPKQSGQAEPKQYLRVSNTQRFDFPAGGTLRLKDSVGLLTVEAWDQPGIEITTIKSAKAEVGVTEREKATHQLEMVHVAAERDGDEVAITTEFPRHLAFPPNPLAADVNVELEIRIKAPAATRIVDNDHKVGEVNIDGLTGDMNVHLLQGAIMLHLPDGQYNINAKADFGSVNSDFPGQEKRGRWLLGHRVVNGNSPAQHSLNLKVGFGDIILLKVRLPKAPGPMIPGSRPEGL